MSGRDWALETMLRDEKLNVKQLEERNRALREHVLQLEANMIRREGDLTDRTSSQFSGDRRMYEHIDSLQSPLPRLEAVGSTD